MNADRRVVARVCIELLKECDAIGLIRDESHLMLVESISHLKAQEYWQLKNQEKHEGKNVATDLQLSISRVALPALEAASAALEADDYTEVIYQLHLAVTTDGKAPTAASRNDLRKARSSGKLATSPSGARSRKRVRDGNPG